jgi:poly(3-hydroxybutyrate) depolymerase
MADTSTCIVIYPDAVTGYWNAKTNELADSINDVGFISILIDYFRDVYHCDARRVYVTGISNGGQLAYRLTCDIPFKITAIAPFVKSGVMPKCPGNEFVAITTINQSTEAPGRNDIIEAWRFFMSQVRK